MYAHLKVFVLAPFSPAGLDIQETLRNAVAQAGGAVVRMDEAIGPGARWSNAVMRHIREADLIIAETSQQNPNVFLQLGSAD